MKKAFSLSITLFISIILLSLSFYFLYITKKEVKFSSKLNDKLQAYINALSLSEKIKFFLATGETKNYYILNNNNIINLPEKIRVDNHIYKIKNITFSVQDANGLLSTININPNLISKFAKNSLVAKDSLLDWLDKDSLVRPYGAEKEYYLLHRFNYLPRNSGFIAFTDELYNIRGFENFYSFKKYLIFTPNGLYNYLTMPYKILYLKYNISINDYNKIEKMKKNFENKSLLNFTYKLIKNKFNYNVDLPFISNYFLITIRSKYNNTIYNMKFVYDKKSNKILFVFK